MSDFVHITNNIRQIIRFSRTSFVAALLIVVLGSSFPFTAELLRCSNMKALCFESAYIMKHEKAYFTFHEKAS
jgi:hypothetical protein